MKVKGITYNNKNAEGEAVVINTTFSFTSDFDYKTGKINIMNHEMNGYKISNKILVIYSGKGAVNAPIGLYKAMKSHLSPLGIICVKADPLTIECAITIDIAIIDSLDINPLECIKSGDFIKIKSNDSSIIIDK